MLLEGGIEKNYTQNWDKDGNIYYTDENGRVVDFKVNPFVKLANKVKAGASNFGDWINESNPNSEAYKQKVGLVAGLATAPLGIGELATAGVTRALAPYVGRKIAQNMATGLGSGVVGGGIGGGLEAGLNNENILAGGLKGSIFGGLGGLLGGYGLGKVGQKFERGLLQNNPIAQEQYFNNYIADLNNKTKAMADFRAGKLGSKGGKMQLAYDLANDNSNISNYILDKTGKPMLFSDDSNVYITDGYSNSGISKYSYKGSHRAPSSTVSEGTPEYRAKNSFDMNLNEVLQGLSPQPDDYFSANGPRWYGYDDAEGLESLNAIRRVKNGANDIMAYRAVPNTVNSNTLNNGDWITFSKKYAQVHGDSNLGGDYKIIKQKVSPNEVWWDGNDIREWGYDNGLPQKPDIMLSMKNPYYQDILPDNWKEARKIRDLGYDGIITKDGKYLIFEKDQIKRLGDL